MDRLIAPWIRWGAALAFQGFILRDAVWFTGWVCPAVHLIGLLLLPLTWSPLALMLAGGVTGIILDLLTANGGLWTSSGLLFGALLPMVNRLLAPREGYESESQPTATDQGLSWFITRGIMLIAMHELWRFGLEAGRWGLRWQTFPMALTSAASTTMIFVLIHKLFAGGGRMR